MCVRVVRPTAVLLMTLSSNVFLLYVFMRTGIETYAKLQFKRARARPIISHITYLLQLAAAFYAFYYNLCNSYVIRTLYHRKTHLCTIADEPNVGNLLVNKSRYTRGRPHRNIKLLQSVYYIIIIKIYAHGFIMEF